MKADLTRDTFHPLKHYARVLTQQGRVQLDADINERAAILLRYLQTLAADLIGPAGGPGFAVMPLPTPKAMDFQIGFGDYYANGLLCQADFVPMAIFPTTAPAVFQLMNRRSEFELRPNPYFYEIFDGELAAGAVYRFDDDDSCAERYTRRVFRKRPHSASATATLGSDKWRPGGRRVNAGHRQRRIVQEDVWLTLEDGVQIRFQPGDPVPAGSAPPNPPVNQYLTGDYWLIPARTATGDVEWPKVTDAQGNPETDSQGNIIPVALPPHGITHYYAPLAIVTVDAADGVRVRRGCRKAFSLNTIDLEQ